jgi:glycosyltransferase involved in cell wall biosynthesis
MKTLNIVTSAFNEEDCLPEFFERTIRILEEEKNYSWKILAVDNGSFDGTWSIIQNFADRESRIIGFQMSRNFNLDAAFTCGLDHSESDLVVIMASDLQDPPEVIPSLLRKYEEGFDHVIVKITKRKSVPFLRRILSLIFYRFAARMTNGMLPESVSDFRLMNKKTYSAVRRLRENHRFMRGLGAWVGFKTTEIEIERPPRFAGKSSWLGTALPSVIASSLRSIFAYSAVPLSWVSTLGLIMSFSSIIGINVLAIFWIVSGVPFAGFGSIIGVIILGFSLTMLCIGILAQYLGLIYEEVKQRPLYLVAQRTNE